MKSQLFLITLFCFLFSLSAGEPHNMWLRDFEQAKSLSQAESKPILMVFSGSDWCKPCMKLQKEVFDDEAFISFSQELVLLELDFPRSRKNQLSKSQTAHNEQLAEQYNKQGAFPMVLLLNAEGKILGTTGYRQGGASSYVEHLKSMLPTSAATH